MEAPLRLIEIACKHPSLKLFERATPGEEFGTETLEIKNKAVYLNTSYGLDVDIYRTNNKKGIIAIHDDSLYQLEDYRFPKTTRGYHLRIQPVWRTSCLWHDRKWPQPLGRHIKETSIWTRYPYWARFSWRDVYEINYELQEVRQGQS